MTYYEQHITNIRDMTYQKHYVFEQLHLAKKYIHAHFEQAITIDQLAAAAYFSKYHFLRSFKSAFHCTPHEYLTAVRIQKAKQLLRKNKPVSEVCISVGFSSTSSFKNLFKRHTRLSPSAYKRQPTGKNQDPKSYPPSPFLNFYKKAIFESGESDPNPQF